MAERFTSVKKVLVTDNVSPCCKEALVAGGLEVVQNDKMSKEELMAAVKEYDALIVRSATKVTAEIIESTDGLKIIGRAGTGVDNIDVAAASKKNIAVMNTPTANTVSAAEQTCALFLSLARHTPAADASMKAGNWDRKKFMGTELYGKTAVIIGLGHIGREVAIRLQAFGMKTVGFDALLPAEDTKKFGVDQMPLEELWPIADYISVHVPLLPATKGMIGGKTFEMCKPGLKVINCARGGIIDNDSLVAALESGKCGGAALDVFINEPPTGVEQTLAQHPKVIACPHLGASTKEAQLRVAREIADQIVESSQGKSLKGIINGRHIGL
ncbi:D-3-phosphoglycerate dehydrogenase-like [Sycon ciliatum]|uniref:D-3-phosphoglycerate dehydrogenase-like n=1 Tax=Sycon ciliatum TaxID=27933 RepID=UPI0020AA4CB6|eukprot:scpid5099/ scgid24455/ D-3-phosphoglycerate dehydrogenase; A10